VTHRSHYGSDYHPDLNYDLMADDVLRFLDKKGLKKVTMGGLCFGGRAAMRFASKYPERIEGLALVEATVGDYVATDGVSGPAWKSLDYAGSHLTLREYKEWARYMSDAMNYDGWINWVMALARKDTPLDEPVQFKIDLCGVYKGFYEHLQFLPADWVYTGPVMLLVGANT
jgi:pimeloyl-ACP methyl ester carboxylesterase